VSIVDYLDRTLYPDFQRNWDDTLFRERIAAALFPEAIVLDVGAGAGIVSQMNFRGSVARMCGIDLDPRVLENPMLDEGHIADAAKIPYSDDTFDVVFADNVMEHIADPHAMYREVHRVLKPEGVLLFKTPNKTHYMPAIARMTPHWFHQFINRIRGRDAADTFPTLYRSNTVPTVRALAARAGFEVVDIDRVEGRPEYLRMNPITYVAGAAYERFVNAAEILAPFRILLIAQLRKRSR
jgi:ubiquinone/menaquinone biosynthesis C-methylase UbiE